MTRRTTLSALALAALFATSAMAQDSAAAKPHKTKTKAAVTASAAADTTKKKMGGTKKPQAHKMKKGTKPDSTVKKPN